MFFTFLVFLFSSFIAAWFKSRWWWWRRQAMTWPRKQRLILRSPSAKRASSWLCSSFCQCSSAATVDRASSTASTRSSGTAPRQDATSRLYRKILRNHNELCRLWLDSRLAGLVHAKRDRWVVVKLLRRRSPQRAYIRPSLSCARVNYAI